MSKGGRLSRLIPKFFRGRDKSDGKSDSFGPICLMSFLDDTEQRVSYKNNWKGQMLLDIACDMINLLEKDYFGLRFVDDSGQVHWIEPTRSLSSQVKGCSIPFKVYFCIKFYAADPCKLRDEVTRYLFFLQIKRDILQGRLPVTFEEAAELCAYAVQSELGDFEPRHNTVGYVSEFCFVPNQSEELEAKIASIHRRCIGATPLMAEHRFLEKVKWLDMYGVDLHPVQGESSVEYFLGLTPTGVVVYKHKTKVACYFWPRVTKATYKGKTFILKVKDKNNDEHTCAFELSTKAACKHLWKCCVEHHAFFRLSQAVDKETRPRKVLRSLSNASTRGRSERLAMGSEHRSASQEANVLRVPSRRQPRRVNSDSRLNVEHMHRAAYPRSDIDLINMGQPEPIRAPRHRSLPELQGRESPRSVKSAPWESKFDHGLYTSGHESPTSGRSERHSHRQGRAISGSDSESGFSQRRKYFPVRKNSDNDSDMSPSRRRRREADSESDSDVSLTNSNQGRKIIFQPNDHNSRHQGHMLFQENRKNGSIPSLHSAPAGDAKQRRRRRRTKSPANSKRPPEEIKQHIEFDLVEPDEGLTDEQLMDIPYTNVETKANLFRLKYSPKTKHKIRASRVKSFGEVDQLSEPGRGTRSEGEGKEGLTRQTSGHTDPGRGARYISTPSQPWLDDVHQPYGDPLQANVYREQSYPGGDTRPGSSHLPPGYPSDRPHPSGRAYDGSSHISPDPTPSTNAYPNPVYFDNREASNYRNTYDTQNSNLRNNFNTRDSDQNCNAYNEDRAPNPHNHQDSYEGRGIPPYSNHDRSSNGYSNPGSKAPPPSYTVSKQHQAPNFQGQQPASGYHQSPGYPASSSQHHHYSSPGSIRGHPGQGGYSSDIQGSHPPHPSQGIHQANPHLVHNLSPSPARNYASQGATPPRGLMSQYAGAGRGGSPSHNTQRQPATSNPSTRHLSSYYDFSGASEASGPPRHHSPSSSGYSGSHSHHSNTMNSLSPQQGLASYNQRAGQYRQPGQRPQPSPSTYAPPSTQAIQSDYQRQPSLVASYRSDLVTEL